MGAPGVQETARETFISRIAVRRKRLSRARSSCGAGGETGGSSPRTIDESAFNEGDRSRTRWRYPGTRCLTSTHRGGAHRLDPARSGAWTTRRARRRHGSRAHPREIAREPERTIRFILFGGGNGARRLAGYVAAHRSCSRRSRRCSTWTTAPTSSPGSGRRAMRSDMEAIFEPSRAWTRRCRSRRDGRLLPAADPDLAPAGAESGPRRGCGGP